MTSLADTPEARAARSDAALTRRGETIAIRQYTGTGESRTSVDYACKARVVGFKPDPLVGAVKQGDRRLIVSAGDLVAAGLTSIRAGDKAVVRGKELNIEAVDDSTRREAGTLIAYELTVRGKQ